MLGGGPALASVLSYNTRYSSRLMSHHIDLNSITTSYMNFHAMAVNVFVNEGNSTDLPVCLPNRFSPSSSPARGPGSLALNPVTPPLLQ
ncbi:hypothetical protein E2C01_003222 [Portunus trituberculatus]|uniref:Uncharacterized protein n=1 Tax=Portunus trituberculatus TaxID=210409 RepID=A0A5B7CN50_PORTR|nr:hypothetical protein [Portunus trituberculatus]